MHRTVYDSDHETFRKSVQAFVDRSIAPQVERFAEERLIDRDAWLEAGRQGFLGLAVPEEYGGAGAEDFRFNAVLGEELAAVSMALHSSFSIHTDIVAPYLVELSTPEQKERWLPGFCDGTKIAAIGMTEPAAGSDLAGLKTTAVRDGSDWILNGSKTFITNGYRADLVVVAAKTDPSLGAKGISLFVVEEGMPGFERGRKLHKVGQHEADTAELFFTDVRLPASNLLGEEGRGFVHMMERLPQERLTCAIGNIAQAAATVAETLRYVQERKAFGQAIGHFQTLKHRLAEVTTQIDVTRSFLDACLLAHVQGDLTAVDAAKAKWWSADVQNQVVDACLQMHGGYGYMTEYPVARAWMDARVTRIWAGSNEIMKEIIGRDLGL